MHSPPRILLSDIPTHLIFPLGEMQYRGQLYEIECTSIPGDGSIWWTPDHGIIWSPPDTPWSHGDLAAEPIRVAYITDQKIYILISHKIISVDVVQSPIPAKHVWDCMTDQGRDRMPDIRPDIDPKIDPKNDIISM